MKRVICALLSLTSIIVLLGFPSNQVQAVNDLYVSVSGTGTNCIESFPCSLQTAAENAKSSATIYVQEGIYTRSVAFEEVVTFGKTVLVKGSCIFDGNDATLPVCGQPAPHRSIIDGENNKRGILIENHDQSSPPNVYLHHFDIQNGEADEVDLSDCTPLSAETISGCGGGIFIHDAAIIYLNDFNFSNNKAGNLLSNTETGFGGAVYIQDTWDVTITNSTFSNNAATWTGQGFGGGVYATYINNEFFLQNNTFSSNYCTTTDSTQSKGCGAMFVESNDVYVQNNTFTQNNPSFASAINGTSLYFLRNHSFKVSDNDYSYNKGSSVLYAENDTNVALDVIAGNSFYNNDQALDLIKYDGKYWVNIYNNFFSHNDSSTLRGGPAYTAINLSSNYVAPIKSIANIYHNSISIADYGMNIGDNFILIIKNNIISYTHLMGIKLPTSPTNLATSFKTNLFYNNTGGDGFYDPTSVNKNPGFINLHSNLHLQEFSWAIDRGTSGTGITTDIDGDLRPNSGYDIGADEAYGYFYLPLINR